MEQNIYEKEKGDYLGKNPTWHVQDSPWKATQILKMIERNKLQPKSVVEIGCGAGEILNQLHQRLDDKTIEFSGYEIAPDAFKLCLERKKERLQFYQEDLLQTQNNYDLMLMIDVFEHVDDYIGFIKSAAKRSTYTIYHIPMDMSAYGILTNYPIGARRQVGHLHHFMKDTALATLTYSGREIVDWFYTCGSLEVNNKGLGFFGTIVNLLRRITFKIKPDLAVKAFGGFSLLVLTK